MTPFRGIRLNVLALVVTSFLTGLSSEIIYPLAPQFLTSVLGAPYAVVGLIEGIAERTASLLKVASGFISDRWPRRRPLAPGGMASLLSRSHSWPRLSAGVYMALTGPGAGGRFLGGIPRSRYGYIMDDNHGS